MPEIDEERIELSLEQAPESTKESTPQEVTEERQNNPEEISPEPSTLDETQTEPVNVLPLSTISEAEWELLKSTLDKRYTEIATLLRYNKTREETIQRLSAEAQKYRDGFAFSALKPFINTLISFVEECRKSERDASLYADTIDDEKAKKYIGFLVDEFEQILINIGLERSDSNITINKRPLVDTPPPKTAQIPESEQITDDPPLLTQPEPINTIETLFVYLNQTESTIINLLKDREISDQTIQALTKIVAHIDSEHHLALVAPIARQLYTVYDKLSDMGSSADISPKILYEAMLAFLIHRVSVILTNAGVQIESDTIDGMFDTQRHKIVKTIPTDDEQLDRKVESTITQCYTYDGKIIYHSKVNVYKYQNPNKGEI